MQDSTSPLWDTLGPGSLEALERVTIAHLSLTPRVGNALRREGLVSVAAVLRLARAGGLGIVPGIGPVGVGEIESVLVRELPALLAALAGGDPAIHVSGRVAFGLEDAGQNAALRSLPLEILEVSARPREALRRAGLRSVGAVIDVGRHPGLDTVVGVGVGGVAEITGALLRLLETTADASVEEIRTLAPRPRLKDLAAGDPWLARLVEAGQAAPPIRVGPYEARVIHRQARPFLRWAVQNSVRWVRPHRLPGLPASDRDPFDLWIHTGDDSYAIACRPLGADTVLAVLFDESHPDGLRGDVLGLARGPDVVGACVALLVAAPRSHDWTWDPERILASWIDSPLPSLATLRLLLALDHRASEELATLSDDALLAYRLPGGDPHVLPLLAASVLALGSYRTSPHVAAARGGRVRSLAEATRAAPRLLRAMAGARSIEHGPFRAYVVEDAAMDPVGSRGWAALEAEVVELELTGGIEMGLVPADAFMVEWGRKLGEVQLDGVLDLVSLYCCRLDTETFGVFWRDLRPGHDDVELLVGFGQGPDPVRTCAAVLLAAPPLGGVDWDPEAFELGGTSTLLERADVYRLMLAATGRGGPELLTLADEDLIHHRISGVRVDWQTVARLTEPILQWWPTRA